MFVDHLNDTSQQVLHGLGKQFLDDKLPTFVKTNADDGVSGLPASAFADPVSRAFPVHTKSATFLSSLYFQGQAANDETWSRAFPREKVAERLSSASQFWGLSDQISQLTTAITEKSAASTHQLTDADYALIMPFGGETVKRFPVVNAKSAAKAATNLLRDRVQYPYAWRKHAAANILQRAMTLHAELPANALYYLTKAAGLFAADNKQAARALRTRALVFPTDMRETFRKAAAVIANTPVKLPELTKLCELLDNADRQYNRHVLYRQGMPVPEEILFAGPAVKSAAAASDTIMLVTGNAYHVDDIKSAGLEPFTILSSAYVEDLAADDQGHLDMDKVAALLPTIPRDDAQLLDKSFHAMGIQPVAEKSAASTADDWLDSDAWLDFAKRTSGGRTPTQDFSMSSVLRHPQDTHDRASKSGK